MEAIRSLQTSMGFRWITYSFILEGINICSRLCEKYKCDWSIQRLGMRWILEKALY